MEKIPVVAVVGPTASGKTALSVALAQHLNGEIISADSMQVYRYMDIATAKPSPEERGGVPHHLMDFLDPSEEFSVARFCEMAHEVIRDIHDRSRLPILTGGTGLYVDALLNNMSFCDFTPDPALRAELQREMDEEGLDWMLGKLRAVDPQSSGRLCEERNPKRIIRALEVYLSTGITRTEQNRMQLSTDTLYHSVKIGLTADREYLYQRINDRVDQMLDAGLSEEAERFYRGDFGVTAAAAIGYKELLPYLNGALPLDVCVENLKRATRRYAKRQLTWFRRDRSIHWLPIDELSSHELFNAALELIEKEVFHE